MLNPRVSCAIIDQIARQLVVEGGRRGNVAGKNWLRVIIPVKLLLSGGAWSRIGQGKNITYDLQ